MTTRTRGRDKEPGWRFFPERGWLSKKMKRAIIRDLDWNIEFTVDDVFATFASDERDLLREAYPDRGPINAMRRIVTNWLREGILPGLRRKRGKGSAGKLIYSPGKKDLVPESDNVVFTTTTPKPSPDEPISKAEERRVEANLRAAQERREKQERRFIADMTKELDPFTEAPKPTITAKEGDLLGPEEGRIRGPDITIGTPDEWPEWVKSDESWETAAKRLHYATIKLQRDIEMLELANTQRMKTIDEMVQAQDAQIAEAVTKTKEEWFAQELPRHGEEKVGDKRTFEVAGFLTDGTPLWRDDQGFLGDVRFDTL